MGSFTDLFIRRPVLSTVVSLLILLVGLQAAFNLPVRQYPEIQQTTITITTAYPGANADLIKGFITTPLEQAVASTEGIDTLVSSSQQNVSTITLNLRLNADADRAVTDVLSKVNQVRQQLPREANDPVVVKTTGQGFALMYLSFSSKVLSASQITDYLTRVVQPRLQTLDGVGNAQILGGQTFAMRIWLDPDRMAARGVTPADVRLALASNNFTSAAGQVKGLFVQTSINARTSLDTPEAFANLVVATRGDSLIRLGAVADVELGPQAVDSSSVFDGLKAVFIGVYGTPSANPLTVIDNVRKAMPEIVAQLPPGMESSIAYDSTVFIRASIKEVAKTLGEAAIIVIVVIFLFLGNFRSTLIPVVTIPLSLIGVMVMLLALGYSINLLTLLALVLAIGLVVDDAIVVVENIYRHIEEGMTPFDASIKGAREIAGPVVAMTITLAAVYAPIGFVTGLTGALFQEFAFTLAGAVVVSGIIALTLSPMMCSLLLKPHTAQGQGRFARFLDRLFDRLRVRYERRLHKTLNFRALTVMILAGVMALTAVLYLSTPRELAPEEDQGFLLSIVKTPQYANLDYLERTTASVTKLLQDIPEKAHVFAINGMAGVRQAFVGVIMKPWEERERSTKQVQQQLQGSLPRSDGRRRVRLRAARAAGLGGRTAGAIRHPHDRRLPAARAGAGERAEGRARERLVHLHGHGPEVRHAAVRVQDRRRQGQSPRHLDAGHRLLAGDAAGRQFRQPLQLVWAQLPGCAADAARVPRYGGLADALSGANGGNARQSGRTRAAVHRRHRLADGAAERAHELPAIELGDAVGRAVPRPHDGRGRRLPQATGGELPAGLFV